MNIHPSWFAQFTPSRGGAIHVQYVSPYQVDCFFYLESRVDSEPVFSFMGDYWYRLQDFIQLYSCAREPNYPQLTTYLREQHGT